jgi:hypothetical protein
MKSLINPRTVMRLPNTSAQRIERPTGSVQGELSKSSRKIRHLDAGTSPA